MPEGLYDAISVNIMPIVNLVDYKKPSFQLALLFIALVPTFWNAVGRLERKSSIMRWLCGGNRYIACYIFALMVFTLSAYRNYLFYIALDEQPKLEVDFNPWLISGISGLLYFVGITLVSMSFFHLGITGTYCGDYFGIFMKDRVRSFPFNVIEDPMYLGSFLNFVAAAVSKQSVSGIVLSIIIYAFYMIYSTLLENPYTLKVYSQNRRK